jgi:hypothetical protein
MNMVHKDFEDWARSLEAETTRDPESVVFFHWALEDEYEARLSEALEYFSARPDYLMQECASHLQELETLESRFIQLEEYEKCAAVRDLKADLQVRYKEFLITP